MSWREGLQLGAFPSWGTQRLFSVKYAVRRSKYFLDFSITWGRLKNSR